jgi:NAD(P)H-dependent flavin oxidoreductase YrpB (nitropropane dioxygenase family)
MSKVAERLREEQLARFAAMTVAERFALCERLSREGLAEFMSSNGVDRETAIAMIRRSRAVGRRPSVANDEDR